LEAYFALVDDLVLRDGEVVLSLAEELFVHDTETSLWLAIKLRVTS